MNGLAARARRLPFFYGWVVVACAACASVARQAGAVAPLSIFIVPMTAEFEWSRSAMSGAVSLGGLLGALAAPMFGVMVDRYGARMMLFGSALVVGGACFALAGTSSLIAFYVAFGISRLTFLGPMELAATGAVAKWFVRRRARAMSVISLAHFVGLAALPLLAQAVIDVHGWRAGWVSFGVVVLLLGALPALLFMVRQPEDIGLNPDGDNHPEPDEHAHENGRDRAGEYNFTLGEALRTPTMWLLMLFSALLFMVQAGMSLHQAPHLIERGLSAVAAAAVISVFSLGGAASAVAVALVGDRLPIRLSLAVSAALVGASTVLMHSVSSNLDGITAALLFGLGLGMASTLLSIAWANYYGRKHYGAIRGVALSVQVAGQAAGPLIAGIMYDVTGSYYKPLALFFFLSVACVLLACFAAKPRPPRSKSAVPPEGRPPAPSPALRVVTQAGPTHPSVTVASAPVAISQPKPIYPIVRLVAALAFMSIAGSAMYAAVTVLDPIAQEFGGGRSSGSLPYTLFMVGFGLGGVAMGRLSDRTGVLIPALIGALCLPFGFFIAASAANLWQFAAALGVFCGLLGAAVSFAPMVSDISHWFRGRRGLAVGIVVSGSYVAGAIWPPILQGLYDTQGWRETFRDLSLFTLCTMVPLALLFYRKAPIDHDDEAGSTRKIARPLGFSPLGLQGLLCLAGVGCCVAMAMPQVHIIPFVTDRGFPAASGAQMLAVMLGFGVISRLASGWMSDRIGGINTLIVGSLLQGIVLTAFLFADSLTALFITSAAFGLAQGGIVPSYAMIIRSFLPADEAGWRIATALLFTLCGMALGGWLAGILYDLTGSYTVSFMNAIGFNVLNLAIAAFLLYRDRGTRGVQVRRGVLTA